MPWLLVVLAGHMSNAGAFIIDKILLQKALPHPGVYVFYIGALGMLAFGMLPFGDFARLPNRVLVQSFLSGATFMLALYGFFMALKQGETSRVVPLFGGLVPVWTLAFASFFLGERLTNLEWIGIALLIIGAVLITHEPSAKKAKLGLTVMCIAAVAAGSFAFSSTMLKAVFNATDFINGFLWIRLFAFLSVLPLLFSSIVRSEIFGKKKVAKKDIKNDPPSFLRGQRAFILLLIGQSMGAFGFVLLAWGTELAPRVTVVNALQGVQYAFLFLLVAVFTLFAPQVLKEKLTKQVVLLKVAAMLLLASGLMLVA